MKPVFIFSGLGADERVFQKLDLSGFDVTFIKWITPGTDELMEHYAGRILQQINAPKPVIIGLSFGGMIAVEVAKQIDTEKVILIASAKSRNELPFYYRLAGRLKLHKLLPARLLKSANAITNWLFGARSTFNKQLLKQILADIDPVFLKWALGKIATWETQPSVKGIYHIHGSADKILPVNFVSCDVKIKGGGHLMTLTHSGEISKVLRRELDQA